MTEIFVLVKSFSTSSFSFFYRQLFSHYLPTFSHCRTDTGTDISLFVVSPVNFTVNFPSLPTILQMKVFASRFMGLVLSETYSNRLKLKSPIHPVTN